MRLPAAILIIVLSNFCAAQNLSVATNHAGLIDEALRKSSLVEGGKPFHLRMEIQPGKKAAPEMNGSMEVFWIDAQHYRLVLNSTSFRQTRTVDAPLIEEVNEGEFYPRWLNNFVDALFRPFPQVQQFRGMQLRLTGGGTLQAGNRSFTTPRCLEKSDRPGGISEEMSEARICFDAQKPWIESGLDFTRYVSFKNYDTFGKQQIPRDWSNDIPENIFVEGHLVILEPLSANDRRLITVRNPTPAKDEIRTVFLSRKDIGDLLEPLPVYIWPPEDTEALEGYMIVYIRTDRDGRIRESYWDSSDNYKLQDAGVRLALQASLKPTTINGVRVQVEGPLVLHFKTVRSASASAPN